MYKDNSYEAIKKRILDNIELDIDKREGSFLNNMSSGIAVEQAKSHIRMDDIINRCFIRTGYDEDLEERAAESGIYRKQGKKSTGSVTVTGEDGIMITNGTIFICGDLEYIMLNDVMLGNDNICYLEALEVGSKYNVLPNSNFKLKDEIQGVRNITNTVEFKGGIDIESDEALKTRYFDYQDDPPTSGNKAHYRVWATEVDGVERAIVLPRWKGNGTVKVMIIGKDNTPVTQDIVNNCKLHIEEEMPLSDITLTVVTPTLLDITISASLKIKSGYIASEIKEDATSLIKYHIRSLTTELTYSKIYGIIANLEGVEDIQSLDVNGATSNIVIPDDKIINLLNIEISEVV